MIRTLKTLIGIHHKRDATAAEIEAALAGAHAEISAADQAYAAAESAYRDGLLRLDESALGQLVADKASATLRRDRAVALVEALTSRLDQAHSAEETARRRKMHQDAEQAVVAAARKVEAEYAKHAAALVELLRLIAEADELARTANEALPEGAERVVGVEGRIRREANVPSRVISSEAFTAWCWASGSRLAPEQEADVHPDAGGQTGTWKTPGCDPEPVMLRRFRRLTAMPEATGRNIPSLASTLNLPGLRASHVPFWQAGRAESSSGILAAIEADRPNWGAPTGSTVLYEPTQTVEIIPLDEPVAAAA